MDDAEIQQLQRQYEIVSELAARFCAELVKQVSHLLDEEKIYLAVPVEARVKAWPSLREKMERKNMNLRKITDLPDLIGLRLVLLFRRDIPQTCSLLEKIFNVISKEDTAERLTENQFGYSSLHYIITIPAELLTLPSLRGSSELKSEIQVRTAAQHIWAASSHVLQYKQEENVPTPLKRSIYRVSALLETVDLEFERVLLEKTAYIATLNPNAPEPLNVDSLRSVLDTSWPEKHKNVRDVDLLPDLLRDLLRFNVQTTDKLQSMIDQHKADILEADRETAAAVATDEKLYTPEARTRAKKGYFFTPIGLTREVLEKEFGQDWIDFNRSRRGKVASNSKKNG